MDKQMLLSWLTTLLSLLSGAWLPTGSGLALVPQGPPPQPWAAANRTQDLSRVVPGPQVTVSALSSWKAFLGLQKTRWLETMQKGQEVATTTTGFLPLDPQEVARETCKAMPFTQVLSHPGCTAARLRNHLCFGRCSLLLRSQFRCLPDRPLQQLCTHSQALDTCGPVVSGGQPSLPSAGEDIHHAG